MRRKLRQARWVEIDQEGALRYVSAEPKCVSFNEEGDAAYLAVEILTDSAGAKVTLGSG